MKNTIRFYYNINADETYDYDEYTIIVVNGDIYAFKKVKVSEQYLLEVMNIINSNNIKVNKIIINKENKIITEYNGNNYILTLLENLNAMDNFSLLPASVVTKQDTITDLWTKKIDYYIKQIPEKGIGDSILVNSFNYYVGMAENAISIYNRCNMNNVRHIVSHRRLNYPLTYPVFLDPTNLIIDVLPRDISEYIKTKFIKDNIDIMEIRNIVDKYRLNNDEMNVLLARLMYPSYYFDSLDKYFINKENDAIKRIVVKIEKYEELIRKYYAEFKDFQLYIVDWIKK